MISEMGRSKGRTATDEVRVIVMPVVVRDMPNLACGAICLTSRCDLRATHRVLRPASTWSIVDRTCENRARCLSPGSTPTHSPSAGRSAAIFVVMLR